MPVSRIELILILAITAVGFAARFACLDELAVEHFDEGVYASNLWFPDQGFQYPDRFLYAPPLLPSLIEWSMLVFSPTRWAPFLPSLVLGSLTVPLAWWSLRRWTSGAAGVAAASLIALSDFHVAMSRSALTDATLVFFVLMAVWLTIEALAASDLRLAAVAGFVTGLAWSTKYNGWLPLAIAVSGAGAAWLLLPRRQGGHDSTDTGGFGLAAIVPCVAVVVVAALLTWAPVWWGLQSVGGYSRVADNHRNYVTGVAGWWPAAVRHEAIQRHYAGWPTLLSGWLAVVAGSLVLRANRSTWNGSQVLHDPAKPSESGSAGKSVKRSTWNDVRSGERAGESSRSKAAMKAEERSTWNASERETGRDQPGAATSNGLGTTGAGSNEQCTSHFVMTALIAAGLAGSIVLSPVVALVVWSLTELVASAWSLRRGRARYAVASQDLSSLSKHVSESGMSVEPRQWFAVWLHLAWLCGLLLATPLYRAYPRLLLPLLCVAWLATGAAIVRLLTGKLLARGREADLRLSAGDASEAGSESVSTAPSYRRFARFAWLVPIVVLCLWRAWWYPSGAWQGRSALADIAEQAVARARSDSGDEPSPASNIQFVMYVYGEPGLFFHIPRDGVPVQPVMDLDFAKPGSDHPRIPTYVLAGPHAWKTPEFGEQFREVEDAMELLSVFPYEPSDFVLLDDYAPRHLARHRKEDVRLYRVRFQ